MRVQGKVVVVAGGSSGIGLASAVAFARSGASVVVILARRAERLEEAAQAIRAASRNIVILALSVDLRHPESVRRAGDVIREKHGQPHIVCCTAGTGNLFSVEESPHSDFVSHFQSTVFTAFNVCKEFLPAMIAQKQGHVVLVGCPAAALPTPAVGFASSRTALCALSESLREDLHDTDVCVTYCEPPAVFGGSTFYEENANARERLPLARLYDTLLKPLLAWSASSVGAAIVRAVERGTTFWSPLPQRVLRFVGTCWCSRPVVRRLLRLLALPPSQGGSFSGYRSTMWSQLYSAHMLQASARAFSTSNVRQPPHLFTQPPAPSKSQRSLGHR